MIVLFLYFLKSNFEVVRRDRWKNRDKCGKIVILSGLKQEIFQVVPDTSEHTILHLFWPNSFPPPPPQS